MVYSSVHLCPFIFKIVRFLLRFTPLSRQCLLFIPHFFFGHSVYFPFTNFSSTFSSFCIYIFCACFLCYTTVIFICQGLRTEPFVFFFSSAPESSDCLFHASSSFLQLLVQRSICSALPHWHILAESNETFSDIFKNRFRLSAHHVVLWKWCLVLWCWL